MLPVNLLGAYEGKDHFFRRSQESISELSLVSISESNFHPSYRGLFPSGDYFPWFSPGLLANSFARPQAFSVSARTENRTQRLTH
jgi:hypothetical protein